MDEAPGADHLVGEYRRLVQNEQVHVVFASISSGSCLACTPLSDELRKTTLLWDCGTQRIFEEGKHPYAFRTQGYGTPEVLAPLLYLLKTKPDFRTLAVINQDYAWGRDSWELWKAGMDALKPGVRVVAEMFPRFGATDFSTEITRLLATRPDVILSTSWGGELVTLVRQASERRLFERSTFVLPVAEASLQTLGRTMPAGHVIGARGDHWNNHPKPEEPGSDEAASSTATASASTSTRSIRATTWRRPSLRSRPPMRRRSRRRAAAGRTIRNWPTPSAASPSTRRPPPSPCARTGRGWRTSSSACPATATASPSRCRSDMVIFPAAMVSTPVGQKSVDWLKSLKPDLLAQVPAPIAT